MTNTLRSLALALTFVMGGVAFSACSDDVQELSSSNDTDHDELYYAQNAIISCSDSAFTGKDEEGEIHLAVSGGEVVVDVDCGAEWFVYNDNPNVFSTDATSNSLTVSAGQNLVKSERTGTIYLMTRWYRIIFATITVTQDAYGAPEITIDTKEWHVPAVGELSTEIAVEANGEWTAESDAEWLTIGKTESGITLTAAQNPETTERAAEVVLTCADGYNSASQKIKVTQDALAYINLGAEELTVYAYEYTTTVIVESNYDWDYSCNSDWITVERGGNDNYLIVSYTTNESTSEREAVLTVTAGDGMANVTESEFKIIQEGFVPEKSFILEYTISSSGKTIALPLSSVTTALVNWGDGEFETTLLDYPSHTYSAVGTYTVTINGSVGHIQSYESKNSISGADCLTAVIQWGDLGLTDMSYGFYGCTKLESLPKGAGPFSNVASFSYGFYNCKSLTEFPEEIFENCVAVKNFSYVFGNCTSMTSISENIFSCCAVATDFSGVFYGCTAFTAIPENLFSNCTAATDFSDAFYGCNSLNTIPESVFCNCTAATDFSYVFGGCTKLTSVPEGIFSNCVAATNFSYVFYECTKLTSAPSFEGLVAATTFRGLFDGCTALTSVPENIFSGCTAVTDFRSLFDECGSLTSVPENIFSDCASVTDFISCFSDCSKLTSVPSFSSCTVATDFNYTFYMCNKVSGESPYTEIIVDGEAVKVHLYERYKYPDYFVAPTSSTWCFYGSSFSDRYSMPYSWTGTIF